MPGANTTIDARAALRTIIDRRYGVDVVGVMWSTISPADNPPEGLRSADADDWQLTLERASAIMSGQRYTMADVTLDEAEATRTEKLISSVVLLVSKASSKQLVETSRRRRHLALLFGSTATAGIAIGLLTFHFTRKLKQ